MGKGVCFTSMQNVELRLKSILYLQSRDLFSVCLHYTSEFQVDVCIPVSMKGYKHDPRQLQQPHDSHTHALSQVCPNNLSGGPILT